LGHIPPFLDSPKYDIVGYCDIVGICLQHRFFSCLNEFKPDLRVTQYHIVDDAFHVQSHP
jgi:hypothetical protein